MINTKIIDEFGNPLICYHGTNDETQFQDKKISYFTSRTDYAYIEKSNIVYPCLINIEAPYYVDRTSEIEALRSNPEKIKILKKLGYDGVIYSQPGNLKKGYTGWANDCPQFITFEPNQIISAIGVTPNPPNFESIHQKSIIKDANGKKLKLYHGTNKFFKKHKDTKDIGYHFGTKGAAIDRMSNLYLPEFQITENDTKLSKKDKQIIENSRSNDLRTKADSLLRMKIKYPRSNLIEVISSMSEIELIAIIEEYKNKPDIDRFNVKENRHKFDLLLNNELIAGFDTKTHARAAIKFIESNMIKCSYLRSNNPLRLDDLGLWSPDNLAREISLSKDEHNRLSSIEDETEKFNYLKSIILNKGFDSIVYTNEVEGKKSDSYIAFDASQIIEYPEKVLLPKKDVSCDYY